MRQAVCQYAERAAEKLRGERQYCRHISTFIKTSPFAVNEPYYGNVATEKLHTPTRDTPGHYRGCGQVSGQRSGSMATATQKRG
ncbi:DNA polymerase V subunit UmuC [Klebsiella pneumoniae]|uniref:DNA polymerase V subunit UmuC n=1 Tax=Klebsiella pneumoniae TaxID=573 RepID=A0A4P0XDU4_KLEPN|nr:DNA polymerase V subunit UmuC [Klebsiella pneumoniae]